MGGIMKVLRAQQNRLTMAQIGRTIHAPALRSVVPSASTTVPRKAGFRMSREVLMSLQYNCANCGKPMKSHPRSGKKYCSHACAQMVKSRKATAYQTYTAEGLSTGKVGAVSELLVSADLILRGYEVFRAVSQSASCDLVIFRGDAMLRVEVRTGRVSVASGKVTFASKEVDTDRSDVFAVVVQGPRIVYLDSKTRTEISL